MANDLNVLDMQEDANGFCIQQAKTFETEIERLGIALGVDWSNTVQVQELAHEAMNHVKEQLEEYEHHTTDYQLKAKLTLFAIAEMMMQLMANSACEGIHTHGGHAWKAFSKALLREKEKLVE